MSEYVHYNSENNRWYRHDTDAKVKVYGISEKIPQVFTGVQAATYVEAFESLYGYAPAI